MSDDIAHQMDAMISGDMSEIRVVRRLNKMFVDHNAKHNAARSTKRVHVSAVLGSAKGAQAFCLREQILGLHYTPAPESGTASVALLRTYLAGTYIHEMWQDLLVESELAKSIEDSQTHAELQVDHTPDAVVDIFGDGVLRVMEIKSAREKSYMGFLKVHTHDRAYKQCQLYMHLTGIHKGIILVQNKNDQDFFVHLIDYDPEFVKPYVERLELLKALNKAFAETGRLPKNMLCAHEDVPRAQNCPMRQLCFANRAEREKSRREDDTASHDQDNTADNQRLNAKIGAA